MYSLTFVQCAAVLPLLLTPPLACVVTITSQHDIGVEPNHSDWLASGSLFSHLTWSFGSLPNIKLYVGYSTIIRFCLLPYAW